MQRHSYTAGHPCVCFCSPLAARDHLKATLCVTAAMRDVVVAMLKERLPPSVFLHLSDGQADHLFLQFILEQGPDVLVLLFSRDGDIAFSGALTSRANWLVRGRLRQYELVEASRRPAHLNLNLCRSCECCVSVRAVL